MANKTVYPYGTDGRLPSSIGIVNDYTTGGVDKALSAEAGKNLNTKVESLTLIPNTTPLPFSKTEDFESGNLTAGSGAEAYNNNYIRSRFIQVAIGAQYSYSLGTGYSLRIFFFTSAKVFLGNSDWLSGSGTYTSIPASTEYVRLVINGSSAPVWEDVQLSFTPSVIYRYIPECEEYSRKYAAISGVPNDSPIALTESDFEAGTLSDGAGKESTAATVIRTKDYIQVYPGAIISFSTAVGQFKVFEFAEDKSYIAESNWKSGSGTYDTGKNTFYVRFLVYSGTSSAPVWSNIQLSVIPNYLPEYARAVSTQRIGEMIDASVDAYGNLPIPILAPSPQKPADESEGADINADTMTSTQIQSAIESVISSIKTPNPLAYYITPYGTVYDVIGRDSSNQYDIKAYVFTRRNMLCWRAAGALYAWVNGSATYYTDHRSPLVGDAVYSDSSKTSSGYTVSAYDSSTEAITVNGKNYTRDDSKKIAPDEIFTRDYVRQNQVNVYNKTGTYLGRASTASVTELTYSGKTYTRYSSRDFHTDNKATIVLWGNEHGPSGDPNEPSIILYRLVKDLTEGCAGNPFLQFLHNYCKIVIIPAANPYGINVWAASGQEGRNNANNVNINRNYDTRGWAVQPDADKGSYAGDQPETQFIMNTVLDVEADIAIDIHCLGNTNGTENGFIHHDGDVPDSNSNLVQFFLDYCGLYYTSYGNASPDSWACGDDWIYSIGISGGLIEMNPGNLNDFHTGQIMWCDYTMLLNTIRMWYSQFDPSLDLRRMSIK